MTHFQEHLVENCHSFFIAFKESHNIYQVNINLLNKMSNKRKSSEKKRGVSFLEELNRLRRKLD